MLPKLPYDLCICVGITLLVQRCQDEIVVHDFAR